MADKVTIPSSADELQELLADDKKRTAIFADAATTKEFLQAYNKATDKTGVLSTQISEQVQAGIVEFLKANGVEGRPDQTQVEAVLQNVKPGSGAVRNAAYNSQAPGAKADKLNVGDLGDFAKLINHKMPPRTKEGMERLEAIRDITNAYSSVDPASAGYLIPETLRSEILSIALETANVRPRATVITTTTPTTSIPFVDETTHSGSVFGGVTFTWTAEAAAIVASEAKFGRVKLEANKLTGGARIPNELWADAPALSSFLMASLPKGLAFVEDTAFLTGTGVNQPLGVYNSPAVVSVAKETNQAADSIVAANIFKMFSRMVPGSLGAAVWLVNQSCLPELFALSLAVGTGGSAINVININNTPTLTLLGRPLLVTEQNPAIGDAGDVAFVDFSYFLIGDRQAVSMDSSEHSRFMNDETELRIISRVDGRPWVQSALTPLNGATVSPYVTLAARA